MPDLQRPAPETAGDAMRKAATVKERRAAEIVGVVTWLILTPEHQHCDHLYLMPRQI